MDHTSIPTIYFFLQMFGIGSVASVVLGKGDIGTFLSINFGWGIGCALGVYWSAGISGKMNEVHFIYEAMAQRYIYRDILSITTILMPFPLLLFKMYICYMYIYSCSDKFSILMVVQYRYFISAIFRPAYCSRSSSGYEKTLKLSI